MKLTDEQIGAELHALRELPSERFAAELDAWAAEGFPSLKEIDRSQPEGAQGRSSKGIIGFAIRRPALSALAGGAVVVLIVGVSVAGYLGFRDHGSSDVGKVEPFLSAPSSGRGIVNDSAKAGS